MKVVPGALCVFWWGAWTVTTGLTVPRALHAPNISLEEYGVVLKLGRGNPCTARIRVPIPRVDEEASVEVPVMTSCERYLKLGKPFEKVCGHVQKARDWLRATVESLTLIQHAVICQALGTTTASG